MLLYSTPPPPPAHTFHEKNAFLTRRLSLKNIALGRKAAGSVTFTSAGRRLMCSPREPAPCQPLPAASPGGAGSVPGFPGKTLPGHNPKSPLRAKLLRSILTPGGDVWDCWSDSHPAEVFGPSRGKTLPDCRSHGHPWLLHWGSKEIPPLQPHQVRRRGLAPFPLCPLTAIPLPARAFPNGMLRCGELARQAFGVDSHHAPTAGAARQGRRGRAWPGMRNPAPLWMQTAHQLQQQLMETRVY